jgi:hypothetical protein
MTTTAPLLTPNSTGAVVINSPSKTTEIKIDSIITFFPFY